MRLRTAFLWSMIVSLSIAVVLGIAALLLPRFVRATEEIIGTAALVGGFSVVCLIQSLAIDKGRLVWAMWTGMAAAVIALALWLVAIWVPAALPNWDAPLWRAGWVFTIAAGWGVFCALVSLRASERPSIRRMQRLALALATAIAFFSMGVVWTDADAWWIARLFATLALLMGWTAWTTALMALRIDRAAFAPVRSATLAVVALETLVLIAFTWEVIRLGGDWDERIIGVLTILAAGGTIVALVLSILERHARRAGGESMPRSGRLRLELVCPRCGSPQQLAAGPSRCGACGLKFTIEVEEPRCECGFLLYQLTGEKCPECGREIPAESRWMGGRARRGAESARVT